MIVDWGDININYKQIKYFQLSNSRHLRKNHLQYLLKIILHYCKSLMNSNYSMNSLSQQLIVDSNNYKSPYCYCYSNLEHLSFMFDNENYWRMKEFSYYKTIDFLFQMIVDWEDQIINHIDNITRKR